MSPVTLEIREDGIVTSRPVYIKSSFQNDTKRPAICVIAPGKEEVNQLASTFNTIDEKMQTKDELLALVFTRILLVRLNIEVLAKTVWRMR